MLYCVLWGQIFFVVCVCKDIFLKGMGEKLSLSKDERLTPDNGKVMATNVIHQYPPFWLFT